MSRRCFIAILVLLFIGPTLRSQEKRRVYVLHSGMHIILAHPNKNRAGLDLLQGFTEHGVAERDIILLDSPFPTASFKDMVPRAGLVLYLDSADPTSKTSQDLYVRLHNALKTRGIGKNDDLVWVGHSAGGQIGMTMAHLAHNLAKYPDLAKKTQSYHFDSVLTLGTAFGKNTTPADVKLRLYYSAGDTMLFFLARNGQGVADSIKSKVKFRIQCDPAPNTLTRIFHEVEHPNWCFEDRIIKRVLREGNPTSPAWRKTHADVAPGLGMSQLFAQAMQAELRISLEEIQN